LRAGLFGAGVLALPGGVSYPRQELRYDVASPEGAGMLRIFADAVGKMMALPEADPRGWVFQWHIHAVRDDRSKASELARLYPDASDPDRRLAEVVWDTCEAHFDPLRVNFFLPWHRMHLMAFERLVRNVTGASHFTMPYWNYTDPDRRVLPPQFRSPDDPRWKPLFRVDRNPGVNDGRPIDEAGEAPLGLNAMMSSVYSDTFEGDAGFCANLDNAPHSAVHVDVGTRERGMGAVSWAANDPIFWLHHCNIDRIWASWNRAGGRNPSDATYLGRVFSFVDEAGSPLQRRVGDVLDMTSLGYGYDRYLGRPSGSTPFHSASGLHFMQHAASRELSGPVTLGKEPTTVRLAGGGPSNRYFGQLRAVSMAGRPLYLRVAGVRITRQPGVSYEVHLDPAPLASPPNRSSPSYVGTINVFGAVIRATQTGPEPAPYANPRNYSFVITDLVRNLLRAGRLTQPPSVMLVPTGALRPGAAPTVGNISLVSS
jgi:tyrosinase